MSDLMIAKWRYYALSSSLDWVFPDGCQDLVMRQKSNSAPVWYLTSLDESARSVTFVPNELVVGFRFRSGVTVDESRLIASIQGRHYEEIDLDKRIEDYADRSSDIEDVLQLLSVECATVSGTARALGVSVRTLQRKVSSLTGKAPTFWLKLARSRQAVKALSLDTPIADVAADFGFSDQSHFTRECKRWFGRTPSQIRKNVDLRSSILTTGYSVET